MRLLESCNESRDDCQVEVCNLYVHMLYRAQPKNLETLFRKGECEGLGTKNQATGSACLQTILEEGYDGKHNRRQGRDGVLV